MDPGISRIVFLFARMRGPHVGSIAPLPLFESCNTSSLQATSPPLAKVATHPLCETTPLRDAVKSAIPPVSTTCESRPSL